LSARINEFLKPKAKESREPSNPKISEQPPKIDEPAPVAPLEYPPAEAAQAKTEAPAPAVEATESSNPVEAAPPAAPVVAAAA
jgi:hypothetical protein